MFDGKTLFIIMFVLWLAKIPACWYHKLSSLSVYLMTNAVISSIISRKCHLHTTAAAIVCLFGVLLLTQPELFQTDSSDAYHVHPFFSTPDNESQQTNGNNSFDSSNTTDTRLYRESPSNASYEEVLLKSHPYWRLEFQNGIALGLCLSCCNTTVFHCYQLLPSVTS